MKKVVVIIVLLTLLLAILYFVKQNFSTPNSSQTSTTQTSNISPDKNKEIIIEDLTPSTNSQSEPIINIYVKENNNKILIWHQKVGRASGVYFPKDINIWSSDERYAFVMMSGPDSINPLIIRTNGTNFSNGTPILQLSVLFNKQTGYFVNNPYVWTEEGKFSFSAVTSSFKNIGTYLFDPQTESFRHQ